MQQTAITRLTVMDAAVAMGPRNKRRLITSAVSLVVVAAIAAAVFFVFRSSNDSGPAPSARSTHAAPTFVTQKIVYGMTKSDVLRRIGKPAKSVGACWQYNENESIRDGENFLNAERVCFLSSIYSYDYSEIDGKWNYPTTPLKIGP